MGNDWSGSTAYRKNQTNRLEREELLHRLARRQRQLIRSEQLLEIGFSPSSVTHRVRSRRLFVVHRGVYALHPPPYSRPQLWLAAVLGCGPGSLLSDLPAAGHLGLLESPPLAAHVTNRTGRGRSLAGITVHRRRIERCDASALRGIPCTTATRTIIDCARALTDERLEQLLLAADSERILNRRRLEELLDEQRGQPGTARLRSLIIADPVEARSVNERRMFAICTSFGVPLPLVNHRIEAAGRTFYADFCWPELGLIVEADSWRWHGGRVASESDADRDQLLALAGWRVVHFTRDQIKTRRAETGRRLVALTSTGT